ncbi:MAG: cephalosporin hydroxylase family protein [Candidatus Sericytochromatia bacterium]|nr:cephalosporin hydroxylase family protein [Candidatus Sericytochromatia bacterium]
MDKVAEFFEESRSNIRALQNDPSLQVLSTEWIRETGRHKYVYNFTWMGRPIIQLPQDIVAMQELIWRLQPDLIVETGVAHGGSLIFYASMLSLLGGDRTVVGIDIDIRAHNRVEIETHPMAERIRLISGSSVDPAVLAQVQALAAGCRQVLVVLDSNHTHDHVRQELALYAPLVKKDGYIVVFDTVVEDMPDDFFPDRPWGKGNNPKTAVHEFLAVDSRFEIDRAMAGKLLITAAPDGYLKCIQD